MNSHRSRCQLSLLAGEKRLESGRGVTGGILSALLKVLQAQVKEKVVQEEALQQSVWTPQSPNHPQGNDSAGLRQQQFLRHVMKRSFEIILFIEIICNPFFRIRAHVRI